MIKFRILKAELKITPAQEAQWEQFATAMHENAKALDAVQRLEAREQFAKLRAENDARSGQTAVAELVGDGEGGQTAVG